MTQRVPKLIILRGPSGSGKSTVAKKLFERAKAKVCLIQQDHYRFIFRPAGGGKKLNSGTIHKMIKDNVLTALNEGYDVILEGILSVGAYTEVLDEIFESHPKNNYMFYFDISFEETIRRYTTKSHQIKKEFNEKDMRGWYPFAHRSNHQLEVIITETSSLEESVRKILSYSKM